MTASADDTIFALSSGSPPAAVAVIRISGPRADAALEAVVGGLPPPRRAVLAKLHDPRDGTLIDRALVLRFPGPASATGEDVAELHVHGGRAVVAAALAALDAVDALRPAQPGEFTRRAFANGRIDLAEAEGLADLLEAETETQRRSALALAGGALSRRVEDWQTRLLGLAAAVEAELDFSDEGDVQSAGIRPVKNAIDALADELNRWLARPAAERLHDGIRVVIAGPPNAGKSSLLNALVGRNAAITSAVAGTTRDLVEAPTALAGTPFLLIDTAGLRDGGDEIETIGIERAQGALATADIILWLGDPTQCAERGRAIIVHSKADVVPPDGRSDIAVSATTGLGLDALILLLLGRARALLPGEDEVALNARHRAALAACCDRLQDAAQADDGLIVAESIRLARLGLDQITGRAGVEDMLDMLFSRFCIGK